MRAFFRVRRIVNNFCVLIPKIAKLRSRSGSFFLLLLLLDSGEVGTE